MDVAASTRIEPARVARRPRKTFCAISTAALGIGSLLGSRAPRKTLPPSTACTPSAALVMLAVPLPVMVLAVMVMLPLSTATTPVLV
jgi:hypothetical protein